MTKRRWLSCALLSLIACGPVNPDTLRRGHEQLRSAPCPQKQSVSGVAGVNENPRRVYLGDWLLISVCQFDELLKESEAQQKPIHLYVQGIDTGNEAKGIDIDRGILTFILERNETNENLWQPLLYNPLGDRHTDMHVSVGLKGSQPLPQAAGANLHLQLVKLYVDWTLYLWGAFLIAVMIGLFWFGRRSDLVRSGPAVAGIQQPYSLGRVQMAWWFFMILLGYVFIWLVTGDQHSLTPSLLALMGISAATALAAAAISAEGGPFAPRRKLLAGEIAAIDGALLQIGLDRAAALALVPPLTDLAAALDSKAAELVARRGRLIVERNSLTAIAPSRGFWKDLVSDEGGSAALDRFQIVAWTLVLGGVFLASVLWELAMPDFSATLLTLMGISSGTYIGFKFPKASE